MKITMLGVGNGFSKHVYDNNALVNSGGKYAMIDCGTTAWWSLNDLGRSRDDVEAIFVTHIHFDHAGGINSAALYSKHISEKRIRLIVPKPIATMIWENFLKASLENTSENLTSLEDYFDVVSPDEGEEFTLCGNVKARWVHTHHITGKFSAGIVLNEALFFTSDMQCNLPLIEKMHENGIQHIFHDCQFKNVFVHADFEKMKTYPEHLRKKIFLMHHGLENEAQAPDANGMRFLFQHHEMEFDID